MSPETIETASRVLLVLLIAILLIVLYNRLLKALGKGKYQKVYATLDNPEIIAESRIMLIHFTVPRKTSGKLEVLDRSDNLISVLMEGDMEAKNYTVKLDYSELKSGKYAYKLTTSDQSAYKYFEV